MRFAFFGTPQDEKYIHYIRPCLHGAALNLCFQEPTTLSEVLFAASSKGISQIITTSPKLLEKLLGKKASVSNYAGSLFRSGDVEILIIDPLSNLLTVPYGAFVTTRYISKLATPTKWLPSIPFHWSVINASTFDEAFSSLQSAFLVAIDIETTKEPLAISCVGYAGLWIQPDGSFRHHSYVLKIEDAYDVELMRKLNWELQAPKVMQNGKYDVNYLMRYGAPVYNWQLDTLNMMHSWYAELPKDLGFIASFLVRESMYWKDLAKEGDLYHYNALDTYQTLQAAISWLVEAPAWAFTNYIKKFPLNFASVMCELRGIKRDEEKRKQAHLEASTKVAQQQATLDTWLGTPLKVNSPKQVTQLVKLLGNPVVESVDETSLKKEAFKHPLNALILGHILQMRKDKKLISTYLEEKEFNGRILYSINPHGTDTGRNASMEHHFWTGLQIQNVPRGDSVKCTLVADKGFAWAECDLEQAESRGTAHVSGDKNLLANTSGTRDFHSINASSFFGTPYEEIYDDTKKKALNKKLRDLAKRVNHGANYLMGPMVLVDTMGMEKITEAKILLKLPRMWSFKQVAEYLLAQFHRTYPSLESTFYTGVVRDVVRTRMLIGATGWTRYCFGHPDKNKRDKNAYVAHVPQSLNAMIVDEAFLDVFLNVALPNPDNFKLLAQIHDSILFQYRIGHEYLCEEVRKRMERPTQVTGYDGVTRTLLVPAALKMKPTGAKYWNELE